MCDICNLFGQLYIEFQIFIAQQNINTHRIVKGNLLAATALLRFAL